MLHRVNLPYITNPTHYFARLRHLQDFVWLDSGRLASSQPSNIQGRYDIFTAQATEQATLEANGKLTIKPLSPCSQTSMPETLPTARSLEEWIAHHTHSDETLEQDMPFCGGVLGYFGYQWNHGTFKLAQRHNYSFPITELKAYSWSLIVDHQQQECTAFFLNGSNSDEILALLNLKDHECTPYNSFSCDQFIGNTHKEHYLNALSHINDYILAGDCYQINYSQQFCAQYSGDLDSAYLALRTATPSPFGAYIKSNKTHILSASPERFMQYNNGAVMAQPIKGSAPRGKTPKEDKQLAQALESSEKNRAENMMIVDLLRNDLSQCCEPFSVKTPMLCELHSFANVHHLISTVTGQLKPEFTFFDVFRRSFPGGSITGAPKKRAMEIIEELEDKPRGIYCGSIAYFSKNGNADSSITIRTLQTEDNKLYCWGGGGVVADSDAKEEYKESIFKVEKIMAALMTM